MPKVHFVKAAKDYPRFGIVKGENHYHWSIKLQRGGIEHRSKTAPRQSQLTASEYKSPAYAINERIEDLSEPGSVSELESAVDEIKDEAQTLLDEQQGKLDNMPEGLQQGSTGELIQSRIAALEAFISELDSLDFSEFDAAAFDPTDENDDGEPINSNSQTKDQFEEDPTDDDGLTEDEYLAAKLEEVQNITLDVE